MVQWLGRKLGQYVDATDLGSRAKLLACTLFHPQHAGVATNPAFFSGGQFGREDKN
jgi:hypothetical protein